MPEKSVREMSARERRRYSLEGKLFRVIVMTCVILGAVLLIIGLGLYSVSLTTRYVSQAFHVSQYAAVPAENETDSVGLARKVMEVYRGLSEEERAGTGTPEYRAKFSAALDDPAYRRLMDMLSAYNSSEDVSDVYLAMYDGETSALVYIADPDQKYPMYPGDWETVTEKETKKFLQWDGEGMLYDISNTEKYGWMCTAGTPIRDGDGQVCAFLLADVTIVNVLAGMRSYALQISVAMVLVIALLTVLLERRMRQTLVDPINRIAETARSYAADRRAGVKDTVHFASLGISTGDEVENLGLIMADMERDLAEYEENLERITAEKERISMELSLATRIQAAMLPHIFPPFPDRKEFDLYAVMDPAREVGGDFYDYFLIDDDHLCLIMADVSGKGVPAALFMMACKIILDSCAMLGQSAADILTRTNEAVCSNNQEEMFVTVWLGILEISTGKLSTASAGHEYPALKQPGEEFALQKEKHGLVLGGMEGVRYQEYTLQLEPGSKLFLYTDGVPEATDGNGVLFGTDRMLDALNERPDASPEEILRNVRGAVDGFVKDAEQFDDLTMLCMEYRGRTAREE